jgi:hypothetical protein
MHAALQPTARAGGRGLTASSGKLARTLQVVVESLAEPQGPEVQRGPQPMPISQGPVGVEKSWPQSAFARCCLVSACKGLHAQLPFHGPTAAQRIATQRHARCMLLPPPQFGWQASCRLVAHLERSVAAIRGQHLDKGCQKHGHHPRWEWPAACAAPSKQY